MGTAGDGKNVAHEQPSLLRSLSMAGTQSLDKKLHNGVVNSAVGTQSACFCGGYMKKDQRRELQVVESR